MIVADTSALLAILFDEPERKAFLDILRHQGSVLVSSVSVVEARLVM